MAVSRIPSCLLTSLLQWGAQNRTHCSSLTSVGWRRIITSLNVLPTALLMQCSMCLVFSLQIDGKQLLCVHLSRFYRSLLYVPQMSLFQVGKVLLYLVISYMESINYQAYKCTVCILFNWQQKLKINLKIIPCAIISKNQRLKQEEWRRTAYRVSRQLGY